MRCFSILIVAAPAVVGMAACSGAHRPQRGAANLGGPGSIIGTNAQPEDAATAGDDLVQIYEKLAADTRAAKTCAQFAEVVDAWLDQDAADARRLATQYDAAPPTDASRAQALNMRLDRAAQTVVDAGTDCADDPQARAAYRDLEQWLDRDDLALSAYQLDDYD